MTNIKCYAEPQASSLYEYPPFLAPPDDVKAKRDTLWLVSAWVFPRVPLDFRPLEAVQGTRVAPLLSLGHTVLWLCAQKAVCPFVQDAPEPPGLQPPPQNSLSPQEALRETSCCPELLARWGCCPEWDRTLPEKQLEGGESMREEREREGGGEGGAGNWAGQGRGRPAAWSGGRQRRLPLPASRGPGLWVVAGGKARRGRPAPLAARAQLGAVPTL